MNDLYHYYGGDLAASPTGDLAAVDGTVKGQQRVLRRLLTNPALRDAAGAVQAAGDYTWQQAYGAGLPQFVGNTLDVKRVRAVVIGQMRLEDCVAKSPQPVIDLQPIDAGLAVNIQYVDNDTQKQQFLSFTVTN